MPGEAPQELPRRVLKCAWSAGQAGTLGKPRANVQGFAMEGHLQAGGDSGLVVTHIQRPLDVALALAGFRMVLLSRDGARAERGRPGDLGSRQLRLWQVLEEGLPICMGAPQAATLEVQACSRAPGVFSRPQH